MILAIAFFCASALIAGLVVLLIGAARRIGKLADDLNLEEHRRRGDIRYYREELQEYADMMKFLYEEGIEIRPYKTPEAPKFELRINNRPKDAVDFGL